METDRLILEEVLKPDLAAPVCANLWQFGLALALLGLFSRTASADFDDIAVMDEGHIVPVMMKKVKVC